MRIKKKKHTEEYDALKEAFHQLLFKLHPGWERCFKMSLGDHVCWLFSVCSQILALFIAHSVWEEGRSWNIPFNLPPCLYLAVASCL